MFLYEASVHTIGLLCIYVCVRVYVYMYVCMYMYFIFARAISKTRNMNNINVPPFVTNRHHFCIQFLMTYRFRIFSFRSFFFPLFFVVIVQVLSINFIHKVLIVGTKLSSFCNVKII